LSSVTFLGRGFAGAGLSLATGAFFAAVALVAAALRTRVGFFAADPFDLRAPTLLLEPFLTFAMNRRCRSFCAGAV
jgi:hypothetical protein